MKKRIWVFIVGIGILFIICNVYKIVSYVSLSDLFLNQLEVVAKTECSSYEFDNSSLKSYEYYCGEHKETHKWADCLHEKEKCCDSRSQKSKPLCVKD